MVTEPESKTTPAAAESRESAATPTPSASASATAAKATGSPPARRTKATAKSRPRPKAKRSKPAATRRSAPAARPAKPSPRTPATAAATVAGLGGTVADLVERSARPYASAQEQIASATQGTWIAPVAQLNARVITQVASAQADLARRLLG